MSYEPADEYMIETVDALKVLADERRLKLIELFGVPKTVKDVAQIMKIPPNRLYYHVKQLEDLEMLVVVETREVSGITEKTYQTAAKSFNISPALAQTNAAEAHETGAAIVDTVLRKTREELKESAKAGVLMDESMPGTAHQATMYLSVERAKILEERLKDEVRRVMAEFDDELTDTEAQIPFGWLMLFFPKAY